MPGTVLAIQATDQDEFVAAWSYRDQVNSAFESLDGYTLNVLQDNHAVQGEVDSAASDSSVALIMGIGHGTPNSFTGYQRGPIFTRGLYDPSEAADRIIHLTSCETAELLGPNFVQNGCCAFIGYDILVSWDNDVTAGMWFECDAQIDLTLAQGGTVADAHNAAKALFSVRIQQLQQQNKGSSADLLTSICNHLCSPVTDSKYGSPLAKVGDCPPADL